MAHASLTPLEQLARYLGIQTRYTDATKVRRKVPAATVVRLAKLLGAPLDRAAQAADALRALESERYCRTAEPVTTVWTDVAPEVTIRLPGADPGRQGQVSLVSESGERWTAALDSLEVVRKRHATFDGRDICELRLRLPRQFEMGYYRLLIEHGAGVHESLLIVAPPRMFGASGRGTRRRWGLFLPLYALHSESSFSAGNFTDLGDLAEWSAQQGASFVATLPLLACRVDHWDGISPYSPISRLFWNELFIDVPRVLRELGSTAARARLDSPEVRDRLARLRGQPQVDYPAQAALQRDLLELVAEEFFAGGHALRQEYEAYAQAHPELLDYARFRAVWRAQGQSWHHWPAEQAAGNLAAAGAEPREERFQAWVQWLTQRQLAETAERIRRAGSTCYLDLPLGVHGDSYDVWRHRELFAQGAAGGAPPDSFFTEGQNWGFPPLSPAMLRADEYRYWRSVLRHHLRYARLLRIDHVMGLHRLFWIPSGLPTAQGAYVQYPAEELYAILAVESHRAGSELVGENLGTVPPVVNHAMKRHGLRPTYVVQFSLRPDPRRAVPRPPRAAMAGLNTHDMPTWAAFWEGLDIEDRRQLGLIDAEEAHQQQTDRARQRTLLVEFLTDHGYLEGQPNDAGAVLAALMAHLRTLPVDLRLMSLEDLWQETQPQNVPGTMHERPNWRCKARLSLEEIRQSADVARLLALWSERRTAPAKPTVLSSEALPSETLPSETLPQDALAE